MQAKGGGGGASPDTGLDFLWAIVIIMAVVLLTWHFGRVYITQFMYQIKLYEIDGIKYVINYWNQWVNNWNLPLAFNTNKLQVWVNQIQDGTIVKDYKTMSRIMTDVGMYIRYPVSAILIILAIIIYSKNVGMKFKTVFNMKRIRALEKDNWPQITPIIKHDLSGTDIDKGPWSMAMTPMEFCKRNNLLKEKKGDDGRPAVEVITGSARQIFTQQLGGLWGNPNALPIYAKALFGAFAACGNEDREIAFKLLHQIDVSSGTGKLNFDGAEKLFMKHINSKLVIKVLQKHAYVFTVFASMFKLARTDGVFAASEFLWLKPVDRKLWYMLNNVGRQTAFVEVAGAYAHWLAEKKWGAPLRSPMVDQAVKALELSIAEVLYEPEED